MSKKGQQKPKQLFVNHEDDIDILYSTNVQVHGEAKKKEKRPPKQSIGQLPEPELTIPSRFEDVHFQKAYPILKRAWDPNFNIDPENPILNFENMEEQVLTYELVIAVLKYSIVIEEILGLSQFFVQYPHHQDDNVEDIIMITYDLLERNFKIANVDSNLCTKLQDIQLNLLNIKEKLIVCKEALLHDYGMQNIESFIPENIRNQRVSPEANSFFTWINTMKTDLETIIQNLSDMGFNRIEVENNLSESPNSFYVDQSCTDLIRFHQDMKSLLMNHPLILDGALIVQDKISCILISSLVKSLYFKELMNRGRRRLDGSYELSPLSECLIKTPYGNPVPILVDDWYHGIIEDPETYAPIGDSIIVTHTGISARSIAHLGVLLQNAVPKWLIRQTEMPNQGDLMKSIEGKFTRRPTLNVLAFGAPTHMLTVITSFLKEQIGIKNVKVFAEDFLSIQQNDRRVRGSVAILVNPPSSGTALRDPVYHICNEGGDEGTLAQLSQYAQNYYHSFKSSDPVQNQVFKTNQGMYLYHALKFKQAKLIMYTTCSELQSENSDVVNFVMAGLRQENEEKKVKFFTKLLKKKSSKTFTETLYEYVDMAQVLNAYPKELFHGPFFQMPRTIDLNGGFISLIRKKENVVQISRNPTPGTHSAINMENSNSKDIESIMKNANRKFTQLELSNFLMEKGLDSESQSAHSEMILGIPRALEIAQKFNFSITSSYKTDPGKKKISFNTTKKIVERLQIPTFSTLAKQNEKWRPITPVTPSSRPSTATSMDRPKSKRELETPVQSLFQRTDRDREYLPFIHPRYNKYTSDQLLSPKK